MINRLIPVLFALALFSPLANSAEPEIYSSAIGGAISGYDPVAYFTEGKPVQGNSAHILKYNGATWKFSSEQNKQIFKSAPQKYTPQYGGYCAYAVSQGSVAATDPDAWTIHNGKLYLNYSTAVRTIWNKDIPGNISKADKNWPKVLE